MLIETHIAFAVAAAAICLVPGAVTRLTAAYLKARGRRAGIAACLGIASGLLVNLAVTSLIVAFFLAPLLDDGIGLRFIASAYLVLQMLLVWRRLALRRPEADNDNLPRRRLIAIYGQGFLTVARSSKIAATTAALMLQFVEPTVPALPQAIVMSAIFMTIALIAMAIACLFPRVPDLFYGHLRQHRTHPVRRHRPMISGGAVSARYRSIAA